MADNFEQLGFNVKVDGTDSAVSRLDSVIKRLEKIQDLEKTKPKSNNTTNAAAQATDLVKAFEELQKLSSAPIKDLTEYMNKQFVFRDKIAELKEFISAFKELNSVIIVQNNNSAPVPQATAPISNLPQKGSTTSLGDTTQATKELANSSISARKALLSLSNAEIALKNATLARANAQDEVANASIRLQQLRAKETQDANAIAIAENKLAEAKRNLQKAENSQIAAKNRLAGAELSYQKQLEKSKNTTFNLAKSTSSLAKSVASIGKKIKDATPSIGRLVLKLGSALAIARRLGNFISSAVNESSSYIENLNLFAVAFGENYKESLDWALELANNFGLANNEVVKFAGTFRELSTSLGIFEDTADSVSRTVTQLGYDLSALFNTSVEQAMEKLQSGIFSGNVRPLRAFGIDISQNQIDALFETNEALAGLGANARNLSQSDKVLARLIITLQSGSDAFGTMNREINNLQSQIRILQGSLSNFKLAIGDLVHEPLKQALIYINGTIIAVTNLIRAFYPLQKEDETPKISNLGEEAEEANEALEELSGNLATFDKFNALNKTSQSSSSLEITQALTQELAKQQELYQKALDNTSDVQNKAIEFSKSLLSIFGFTEELETATLDIQTILTNVIGKAEELGFSLSNAFNNFVAETDWQQLGIDVSNAVKSVLQSAYDIISSFDWFAVGESFAVSINQIDWFGIVSPILNIYGSLFDSIIGFINNVDLEKLGNELSDIALEILNITQEKLNTIDWESLGEEISAGLNAVDWSELLASLGETLGSALKGILLTIDTFITTADWEQLGRDLINGAISFIESINSEEILKSSANLLISLGKGIADILKGAIKAALNNIFGKAIPEEWLDIILGNAFWEGLKAPLGNEILEIISSIFGVSPPEEQKSDNSNITNTIIGVIEEVDKAITSGKGLWDEILGWVGGIFGFADGGYSNANLIMTHENGKREWVGKAAGSSAIVNDTQMSDIMEGAVARGVYNALSARSLMSGNNINETIYLQVDGRTILTAVRQAGRKEGVDLMPIG